MVNSYLKKRYFKNLSLILFLFTSIKVTYLFVNSLGGDDLSYWIFNTSLIIDKDWIFLEEIYDLKINLAKSYALNVPLHSFGSSLISIPIVSILYPIDVLFNSPILSNPNFVMNSFMYLGYFFISSFSGILSVVIIKKILNEFSFKFSSTNLLILCLGSSYYYFIFHRFTLNHTFEVLVNSLIIFTTVKFLNKRRKIFLGILTFLVFLALNIRISNYNILFFPIFIYYLHKDLYKQNKPLDRREYLTFSIFFTIFFLIFGIINNFLYGSVIRTNYCSTKQQCDAFIHPFLGQSISDVLQNILNILKNLDGFLFSLGPGLIWSFPMMFFLILFLYIPKIKLNLKFLFLLSISIPLITTLFWRGLESEFNPRLMVGLIPILSVYYFYLVHLDLLPNLIKKIIYILSSYNIFNQFFYHTNQFTTLNSELGYMGLEVPYSNKDINLDILFQFFENILFLPSVIGKSLLGVDLIYITNLLNKNMINRISKINENIYEFISSYSQINVWILVLINLYVLILYFFINEKILKD